jgi:hypothetical protein
MVKQSFNRWSTVGQKVSTDGQTKVGLIV